MPPHRNAYRPVVMGRRGVVTSAHPLASTSGLHMLLQGGNAVDAAVAVASTLNVVEPYMSGFGGIGLMMIYDARSGQRHLLDFVGPAPRAADPAQMTADEQLGGPRACVVPGNPAGWLSALERFGTMPRHTVLAPAIQLAEAGAPLTWKNAEFYGLGRKTLERSAEAQRIYLAAEPRSGQVVKQADLARTYQTLAEGGAEAFYRGPIGRQIAQSVQAAGGWLTAADLADYQPVWREPLKATFRGHELFTVPLPHCSFQIPATLKIIEGLDLEGMGHNSAEYLHALIEAIKLATADRLAYAPRRDQSIVAGLLTDGYAARQCARIDRLHAAASAGERFDSTPLPNELAAGNPAEFPHEHTTHFACADAAGNVVTVTQTLGNVFGSGFAAPGTGVLLNNLLFWADLHPDSPYRLKGGEQPAAQMMMSPTQLTRGGQFALSIGTPGSYGILHTTTQMILNAVVFGMNIQEAIEAPRVRIYRDRAVDIESRVPEAVRADLAGRGHALNVLPDWSWVVGGGQGIVRDPETGVLGGGADPRRDGYALAC
ncbi:MAG: gamma-glutamyltransferase family protein [Chloroflexi bacterium]|nr:gamma-glutamyltransferase family protein [Chloroflexota bacterium]